MDLKPGIIFLVLVSVPLAYSEDSLEARQESVEVKIDSLGEVLVKHVIEDSETPQRLELIDGVVTGITVLDDNGNKIEYARDGNKHIVLLASEQKTTVEYKLSGQLVEKNQMWMMDFRYGNTVAFLFPDEIDLVFVNSRPIYLDEKNGIACHGCKMLLEYTTDEQRLFGSVEWEEDEFLVEIRTLAEINQVEFDQPAKSIRLYVDKGDTYVTTILPTELLGGPYSVFLGDQKVHFQQYTNGTHVWLNAKPDSGMLEIVGTTVIPEFSLMLPLIAGFVSMVVIARLKTTRLQSHTSKIHTRQF